MNTFNQFQMQNTKREQETAAKSERRDSSNNSKHSSSSKFLKRKPDVKKIMLGVVNKKKKQNQISEYFGSQIHPDRQNNIGEIEESRSQSEKNIFSSSEMKANRKIETNQTLRSLQTVKSQNKLPKNQKQLQTDTSKDRQNDKDINNINPFNQDISQIQDFEANQLFVKKLNQHFISSKKSKTQFFEEQIMRQVKSSITIVEDAYQLNFSRAENSDQNNSGTTRSLKKQCESLLIKNKLLQEQIDFCIEKEYLLKTELQHLRQLISEKDRLIDQLSKQKKKTLPKGQEQIYQELQKVKEILQKSQKELQKEMQRQVNLKQENAFLHTELLTKNQQLISAYEKHTQLESSFKHQKKRLKRIIQSMRLEFQQAKTQLKEQIMQIEGYGQLEKCKLKIIQQQQELKYLKIQNQCLLMSKEELHKCENENRKLREQRDYFKRKVLEYVKRSRTQLSEISSSKGSILLQLSEVSIDQ